MSDELHARILQQTVQEAKQRVSQGDGGPFAAIVARDAEVISIAHNEVLKLKDPTAHAEVQAIRKACERLGSFQLDDCVLYCSCEPCPMCLGAIYWARPQRVYYAATRQDAAAGGFDDEFIYEQITHAPGDRKIPFVHLPNSQNSAPFDVWNQLPNKQRY